MNFSEIVGNFPILAFQILEGLWPSKEGAKGCEHKAAYNAIVLLLPIYQAYYRCKSQYV